MNPSALIPYSQDENDPTNAFVLHFPQNSSPIRREIHRHTYYEMFWLVSGKGSFFNDFHWYSMQAGSLGIIAPGHLHTWEANWGQFELYFVGFRPSASASLDADFLQNLAIFGLNATPVIPVHSDVLRHPFEHLFADAYWHYRNDESNEEILLNYIRVILLKVDAIYRQSHTTVHLTSSQALVREFYSLVEANFLERIQINDYARLLGVTANHLVRTVRETTGQTPKQIVQNRLLLEAKRLLIHTIEPASTISQILSFPSASKFGRWFKHLTNLSPGEFRAKGIDV